MKVRGGRKFGHVVAALALLLGGAVAASAAAAAPSGACPANPAPAPVHELPAMLRPYRDKAFIGHGTVWTVALRTPRYSAADGAWHMVKQPWFRTTEGLFTIDARRVGAPGGVFTLDMPPVESYPLRLNSPPGFIPSTLTFSKPGCWKVTARLGRTALVLHVVVDGSRAAVCADLASELRSARAYGPHGASITTIRRDEGARGCARR